VFDKSQDLGECYGKIIDGMPDGKALLKDTEGVTNMDYVSELAVIRMDRMLNLIPTEYWEWGDTGKITLSDISIALNNGTADTSLPYGDIYKYPAFEKNRDYHISRILFFVKHKEEIKELDIDNMCDGCYIAPIPVITDGWHRYAAATWLFKNGWLDKISCRYDGRKDVLRYLIGEEDELPLD
jgi:hypothetical protein